MPEVYIHRIGLVCPMLGDWQRAYAVLSGEAAPQEDATLPPLKPAILKPNERRRTTFLTKLALQAAQDLFGNTRPPKGLQSVFASSQGDTEIIDKICRTLCLQDRPVSPTQFHNSVHNAPSGYWSIGMANHGASTSIGALSGTFASGLLEAAVQVVSDHHPVLLIAYDAPPPEALAGCIHIDSPFAVALLLNASPMQSLAGIRLSAEREGDQGQLDDNHLESLRLSSPPARCLPLLQTIALGQAGRIVLPYLDGLQLTIEVDPCA